MTGKRDVRDTVKRIIIDREKCVGCYNCVLACMATHGPSKNSIHKLKFDDKGLSSSSHIVRDSFSKPAPLICRHCDEPECVLTCISGAMTKDDETGLVNHDRSTCVSCFMCIMSCPFGVLSPDNKTGKLVIKCDFCQDLDMPACVKSCPNGALSLKEVDKYEVFDFGG